MTALRYAYEIGRDIDARENMEKLVLALEYRPEPKGEGHIFTPK